MQCRFWFPHLCTLSLVKLLFRRCFDRKAQNEICKTRDSAIGERVACKNALVDVARDYFLLLSFLTDIYLFLGRNAKMKSHIFKNYTGFGRENANMSSSERITKDLNIAEWS